MKNDPVELVLGSGNLFRDFGHADADVAQLKAILAAEIHKTWMDRSQVSAKLMHKLALPLPIFPASGTLTSADSPDRLMTILNSLRSRVEVSVRVKHRKAASAPHI